MVSARRESIREGMRADHEACMTILKSLSAEQWEQSVPSDEGAPWKARDVLAHLAVSEGGQLGQITRCLAEQVTIPPDFDLNRFNRRSVEKQAHRTVAEMIEEIETVYGQVLATLQAVKETDLDKTGRHARGDVLTVEQFFRRIPEHRRQHAEGLQRALAA